MCGIVAYTGKKRAAPVLYEGLCALEYRGYDSAGIAVLNGGHLSCVRRAGRVEGIADAKELIGNCGIGHTRWATHGGAQTKNAHPHICGKFAVVHNGIIENYLSLKALLSGMGHTFSSETDSETVVHLLSESYAETGDLLQTVGAVAAKLKGSFALAILCSDFPDTVVCVREKSPLIVGADDSGAYAASDVPALCGCDRICALSDGQIALLQGERVQLFTFALTPIEGRFTPNRTVKERAEKGEFAHYMRKEIYEVPRAVEETIGAFDLSAAAALRAKMHNFTRVYIVACGTAYHSALTGESLLERALKLPVTACLAGEFCLKRPVAGRGCLVIAVSQSGETADTLSAVRAAKKRGATVAVITNSPLSSLAREGKFLFVTKAGVEVGVAATKTYAAQLTMFYLLSDFLSGRRSSLTRMPALCRRALSCEERVKAIARRIAEAQNVYFLGRGTDLPSALEGSLKLREVSYIAGAGYAAGELKHGSIALMDENAVVVVIDTCKSLQDKTENTVNEVLSRGATVYRISSNSGMGGGNTLLLPPCPQKYAPLVSEIPLQLLAYYTAVYKGLDPDKPRHLAKSVTVE
jgi:glucosamine--fructose-6-phosphate aminotransferase (isomerizing)